MTEILGIIAILIGMFFFIFGVIGLVRFPDVYMRIHSSGKVSILGVIGLLVGAAFLLPATIPKGIALAIFLIITQPAASHAVASAAYRSGVEMHKPVRDDLEGRVPTHNWRKDELVDENNSP